VNIGRLQQQFIQRYGEADYPVRVFFAPGRVNLIGDHTDYCGGFVFPCAIDLGNTLLIRQRDDNLVNLASENLPYSASLGPDEVGQKHGNEWINYPLSVLDQFSRLGHAIGGIDCLYSGDVPNGAGLSSSAAIEVVSAFAYNSVFDCKITPIALVQLAQRAENEFVGVQCGIMDQFAVTMAEAGNAMQLNCQTLDFNQVPLPLQQHCIVLANSNQRRDLNDSSYNQRVAETQLALELLQTQFAITHLAQASPSQLEQSKELFSAHPIPYQRARHVISEHARVLQAVDVLKQSKLDQFGKLMTASHRSLRDDYAVSGDALDALVDCALEHKGTLGARLTGAGFGGCTVNLIAREQLQSFVSNVGAAYTLRSGLQADFYPVTPGDGAREIHP